MEAVISEKQKSSFDMLNRNLVFILLFSDIIIIVIITINHLFHFSTFILHGSSSKTKMVHKCS